ncbi:DUF1559 domain-containing protein [Blastopirellula sp. J2-11]|nr:DUF1559 domain-containing protein [Blastopirellula sp. J2-11]
MQCTNHLKQLGLSLHNYHDTFGAFPAISYDHEVNGGDESKHASWSWGTLILPQMEQSAAHDILAPSSPNRLHEAVTNATKLNVLQTPLSTWRCPSDTGPELNSHYKINDGSGTAANRKELATANYVGVNSAGDIDRTTTHNGIFVPGTNVDGNKRWVVAMRDILDGTSNTAMVGERAWMQSGVEIGAAVVFGHNGNADIEKNHDYDDGFITVVGGGKPHINTIEICGTDCDDIDGRQGFSSMHPGGTQFLLGDGSVHFVSENIDHTIGMGTDSTYERLLNRYDGQPVGSY